MQTEAEEGELGLGIGAELGKVRCGGWSRTCGGGFGGARAAVGGGASRERSVAVGRFCPDLELLGRVVDYSAKQMCPKVGILGKKGLLGRVMDYSAGLFSYQNLGIRTTRPSDGLLGRAANSRFLEVGTTRPSDGLLGRAMGDSAE